MSANTNTSTPGALKVVWLGDDFTGAAAVMEVLTFAGIPSLLFLDRPTSEQVAAFPDIDAFGIATMARAQSPEWMEENIPSLLKFLDETAADLVHYKICSTLDSAPHTGSIGKVVDLANSHFGPATVPVLTAAPLMRRYQVFGNLFCGTREGVSRLDRHPTMARHPVTPMGESDVARHISRQTNTPTRCLDLEQLANPEGACAYLDHAPGANICTIDCLAAEHETTVGRLLWDRRKDSRFVVGSQGIEYALIAHFVDAGLLSEAKPAEGLEADPRMAVVSGSVSPVTASQIAWARENGFATIRLDAIQLCTDVSSRENAEKTAINAARQALEAGLCPLIMTAEGPDDPEVAKLVGSVCDLNAANVLIGRSLGRILATLISAENLRRVVVSGGDTSGHVCSELGVYALEAAAPTIPGAAICRAKSESNLDGLEIALKGGQMGSHDFFGWIRDGGGARQ